MHKATSSPLSRRGRLLAALTPWLSGTAALMAPGHLVIEASYNFLPVTYPLLIPKLGLTYGQIGTLVLLETAATSLSQPAFGWISDRTDPRWVTVGGLVWCGVLMGLVGLMPSYGALVALVVLAALGLAAYHPPAAALSSRADAGSRGRAMSIFSVGGNLGTALSPLLIGLALSAGGLAATTVLIPLALVAGGALAWALRGVPAGRRAKGDLSATGRNSAAALAAIILVVGARSYYQMGLMTYLPEWLRGQGGSLALAGAALTLFMVAVSAGSLFGGWLSDRFGRMPVIAGSLALTAVGHWLLLRLGGGSQLGAVALIGVMIGASYPVSIVLAQEAWPRSLGFASAMVMGIGWLPAGLGAWVVGQIADASTLTNGLGSLTLAPLVALAATALFFAVLRRERAAQG